MVYAHVLVEAENAGSGSSRVGIGKARITISHGLLVP